MTSTVLPSMRVVRYNQRSAILCQVVGRGPLTPREELFVAALVDAYEHASRNLQPPPRTVYLPHPDSADLWQSFTVTSRVAEEPDVISYRLVNMGWWRRDSPVPAGDTPFVWSESAPPAVVVTLPEVAPVDHVHLVDCHPATASLPHH